MSTENYGNGVSAMKEYESRTLQDMSLYTESPDIGTNTDKFRALYSHCFPEQSILPADKLLTAWERNEADIAAVYSDGLFFGAMAGISDERSAFVFFLALTENSSSRGYAGRLLSAVRKFYPHQQIILPVEKAAVDNDCYHGLITPNKALFLRNEYHPSGNSLSWLGREYELLCTDRELDKKGLESLFQKPVSLKLLPISLL